MTGGFHSNGLIRWLDTSLLAILKIVILTFSYACLHHHFLTISYSMGPPTNLLI